MIRNRLSELLSERGLKTSRVAKEVKIARSSLTSMIQNDSEMVRVDSIDKLCNYLEISPTEFFEYIPISIDFNFTEPELLMTLLQSERYSNLEVSLSFLFLECEFLIDIEYKKNKYTFDCKIKLDKITNKLFTNRFMLKIEDENSQNKLRDLIDSLTPGMKNILFKKLNRSLENHLKEPVTNHLKEQIIFPDYGPDDEKEILNALKDAKFIIDSDIFSEY